MHTAAPPGCAFSPATPGSRTTGPPSRSATPSWRASRPATSPWFPTRKTASRAPAMAYDIRNYASLGILWKLLLPDEQGISQVTAALESALADILEDSERGLSMRLQGPHRQASRRVRELLEAEWETAD